MVKHCKTSEEYREIADRHFDARPKYTETCARGVRMNARERVRREAASYGLVRGSYLTVHPNGRLAQLHLPGLQEPPTPGIRGKVDGMSEESQRRMMGLMHTIERSAKLPAFVHLTFPDEEIPNARAAKTMLNTLLKRWRRRWPGVAGIWRIEAHPERSARLGRPVPHFHLLVWGAWIDRNELSRDWSEIVCGRSEQSVFWKHLAAGTRVESIESFRGVSVYASKRYMAKAEEYPLGEDSGRVWGCFNRPSLPVAESVSIKLNNTQLVRLVRWTRAHLVARGVVTEWMPRTIYLERPDSLLRWIQSSL